MDFLSVSKEWDPLDSLYISGGVLSGVQLNLKERRGGRGCWSIFQFRRGGAPLGSLPLSVWDGVPLEFLSIEKGEGPLDFLSISKGGGGIPLQFLSISRGGSSGFPVKRKSPLLL